MSSVRVAAGDPTAGRTRSAWPVFVLTAVLILASATLFVVVHRITGGYWGDLAIYRYTGQLALHGQPFYGFVTSNGFSFDYPPFAVFLFLPLALLTMNVTIFVWCVLTLAALAAIIWLTLRRIGVSDPARRARLMLVVGIAAIPLYPVSGHLIAGQIDVFIVLLVLADLWGVIGLRWRGVGVGLAAGLKLTPLLFIAYLLLTRRFRAAGVATATFLATVAAGFLFLPGNSRSYWLTGTFLHSSRVTLDPRTVNNQSLRGALARLLYTATPPTWLWLSLVLIVGTGGLAVAVWASRRGEESLGIFACALTGLLLSPVSWHHHWIWCVPALIVLAVRGRHARIGVAVLYVMFAVSTLWLVVTLTRHDLHFTGWALWYDNAYVLAGLVMLAMLGRHLRKGARR